MHGQTETALDTLNKIGKPFNKVITKETLDGFSDIQQDTDSVNETFFDIKQSPLLIKVLSYYTK